MILQADKGLYPLSGYGGGDSSIPTMGERKGAEWRLVPADGGNGSSIELQNLERKKWGCCGLM